MERKHIFWLFAAVLALTACSTTEKPTFQPKDVRTYKDFAANANLLEQSISKPDLHVYVLQFDRHGKLMNYSNLLKARHEIVASLDSNLLFSSNRGTAVRCQPITNLLVLSFGWDHTHDAAEQGYKAWIDAFLEQNPGKFEKGWAVFCVSWDSTPIGLRTFINDYLVDPYLGDSLAKWPDMVTLPVTFWAKAALADRIGYHDLKYAMQYLVENSYPADMQPNIYMVGHSFGCRVLSGFASTKSPLMGSPDDFSFSYQKDLCGGVFVEPALASVNLPKDIPYPLYITQSRHDHLNNLLFPVGSTILNPFMSTIYETERHVSPLWVDLAPTPVLQETNRQNHLVTVTTNLVAVEKVKQLGSYEHNIVFESVRLPYSIAASPFLFTYGYFHNQYYEWGQSNNWKAYFPNTLAQLPFLEIPVKEISWDAGTHKGLFDFGVFSESASRTTFGSTSRFAEYNSSSQSFGSIPTSPGVHYVNCQTAIDKGVWGHYDKNRPANYTLGWTDPLGSHDDYDHLYRFIYGVLHLPSPLNSH